MQAEHMRFGVTFDGAQLDTIHDAHAAFRTGGLRFTEARDGIVIGEGNRDEPRGFGRLHHVGRCARPVRCRRMHVQVDERGGCGRAAHGA